MITNFSLVVYDVEDGLTQMKIVHHIYRVNVTVQQTEAAETCCGQCHTDKYLPISTHYTRSRQSKHYLTRNKFKQ